MKRKKEVNVSRVCEVCEGVEMKVFVYLGRSRLRICKECCLSYLLQFGTLHEDEIGDYVDLVRNWDRGER